MIERIDSILFASELSENSRYFFSLSALLAMQLGARLVILHVMEGLQESHEGIAVAVFGEDRWREIMHKNRHDPDFNALSKDSEIRIIKSMLLEFSSEFEAIHPAFQAVPREIMVRYGSMADEITSQAKIHRCNLVILGMDGNDQFSGQSTNMTLKKIINHSGVPVMVAPLPIRE